MEVEPLTGKRHVTVTEHRTKKGWALRIKQMLDERYPDAIKVRTSPIICLQDSSNAHYWIIGIIGQVRVWSAFGIRPHRQKHFKLSTDPFFIEKVRDIVVLYLNPPH